MAVKIVPVHVLARCPTRQPNLAFMEHLASVVHWILCGVVLWNFGPVWAPGHNTPLIFFLFWGYVYFLLVYIVCFPT